MSAIVAYERPIVEKHSAMLPELDFRKERNQAPYVSLHPSTLCNHDGRDDGDQPCCVDADRREGSGGTADKWRLSLRCRAAPTALR